MAVTMPKIEVSCEYCIRDAHYLCVGKTTEGKYYCLCDKNGHKDQ